MKTSHFICKVTDSINNYEEIGSVWTNQSTPVKAEKFFKSHPFIKNHLGNERYQIEMRQNPILLQDSYDFLKEWKKRK